MTTYTGTADSNGDFTVSFGGNSYTSAEKVNITAEKDGATKTIELFAPSDAFGGGVVRFEGSLSNFPLNIGDITLTQITGAIGQYAFAAYSNNSNIWKLATGLTIEAGVTTIDQYAFLSWTLASFLSLPVTLTTIGTFAFNGWSAAQALTIPSSVNSIGAAAFQSWSACKSLLIEEGLTSIPANCFSTWGQCLNADLPSTITSIGAYGLSNWTACKEIICRATTPPSIQATTFASLKSTCIFKVPAGSVAAYQAATNWSAFAARIQAI